MATNTEVGVKITVDGSQAQSSVGSIKKQLREATQDLIAMREKFGETSAEAVAAAKRVAGLKDEIGDAKALTEAFNPDAKFKAFGAALQGVAGGFAALQGAQALFGAESEELEKTLVKVQGALALSQGLNSVLESVDAFKNLGAVMKTIPIVQRAITAAQFLWNAATAANPIGALVTVIVALIAAGAALIKFFIDSSNEAKRNEAAIKSNTKALEQQTKANERAADQLQRNQKYTLELAKANGASTKEIRALELKLIDEKIAMIASARATALATVEKNKNYLATLKQNDANDELIKKQQEVTNKSVEEANKQTKNLDAANIEKLELVRRQNIEVINEQKKAEEDAANRAKENREKQLQKEKEAAEKRKHQREEEQKKRLEQQKEHAQKIAEQEKVSDEFRYRESLARAKSDFDRKLLEISYQNEKQTEEQLKLLEQGLIKQQEFDARKAIIDAEEQAKKDALYKERTDKETADAKAKQDKLTEDEKKAAEERKKIAEAEAKAKEEIQNAYFTTVAAGLGLVKTLFEKNKGVQKAVLIAENALTIAKIILDAQKQIAGAAASAALVPPLLPPGVPNPAWFAAKAFAAKQIAFAKINAGIGIATSIAATAKGLSQIGGGGSAGGGGSVGGGGQAVPDVTAPPLQPQAQSTLLNQSQVNQIGNAAARAYVVESDVSSGQERIQRLNRAARIG
jgi:hypothetical protein